MDRDTLRIQKEIVELVIRTSSDSPGVRNRAIDSLGNMKNPEAFDALIGLLTHHLLSVRIKAGIWLFKKPKQGVPKLISALKDESEYKRDRVVEVLELIIDRCKSLNKLTWFQIQLKDAVRDEDKESHDYADLRDRVTKLLKRVNGRRNRLLRIDISVDRKHIKPPSDTKGEKFRMRRMVA